MVATASLFKHLSFVLAFAVAAKWGFTGAMAQDIVDLSDHDVCLDGHEPTPQ